MVTEVVPNDAPPDFFEIADLFLSYGAFVSPAFHDGRLVASLALATEEDDSEEAERWLMGICEVLNVETPHSREDAELLLRWRAQERYGLASDDMSFEPLLPDSLFSIAERVRALQEWTQGFIEVLDDYGIEGDRMVSAALKEALQDIRKIAESDIANEFDDIGFDDQGEHEGDLLALQEHIRVASILLWLEHHPGRPKVESVELGDGAGVPTPTVH